MDRAERKQSTLMEMNDFSFHRSLMLVPFLFHLKVKKIHMQEKVKEVRKTNI